MPTNTGIKSQVRYFIKEVTVEPVSLLVFASFSIFSSLSPNASKDKIIRIYSVDPDFMIADAETREQMYKAQIVNWNMYTMACNFPIAIAVTIALGALGDKYGRQLNMLWGIAGVVYIMLGEMIVNTTAFNLPLEYKLLTSTLAAFFGDYIVAFVSAQAFLSDVVVNRAWLTIRLTILVVFRAVGTLIGTTLTTSLYRRIGYAKMMDIGIGIAILAFLVTLWRIPQIPPRVLRQERRRALSTISQHELPDEEKEEEKTSKKLLKNILHSFGETWHGFVVKRVGHRRMFLIAAICIHFVSAISSSELHKLINLFALGDPLNWDAADFARFTMVDTVLGTICGIVGMYVFKKFIRMRDTSIALVALASMTISVIPYSIANKTWEMQLGNVLGCMRSLASPTLTAFTNALVSKHEVGKIYTAFSLTSIMSFLISQFVLQSLYNLTYDVFSNHGFMWLIVGLLNVICFFILLYVHVLSKREHIGQVRKVSVYIDDEGSLDSALESD